MAFLEAAEKERSHLVAVVGAGQHGERGLNDTTTETEDEVERRLLLDVVVRERAAVLELLACKDQALLVRRDALLVLDLGLDVVDRVRGLCVCVAKSAHCVHCRLNCCCCCSLSSSGAGISSFAQEIDPRPYVFVCARPARQHRESRAEQGSGGDVPRPRA